MDRNDQILVGQKIRKLIEKNFGSGFSSKFQGAGKVATLVVSTSSKSFIGKVKFYLKNELQLELHNGSKNHGAGEKNTIQIALSVIDPKTIEMIEKQFKAVVESSKKKVVTEELEQTRDKVVNAPQSPKLRVLGLSANTKFIKRISPFLNGVFRFESKYYLLETENLFQLKKEETDENYLTIHCLNEEVAKQVELATRWFSGNADLIIREGKGLIINFSAITKEKELPSAKFCLPPKSNVGIDEITSRLRHVRSGSRPQATTITASSFCVAYVRSDVVPKIYADLEKMGWSVKPKDKNSFIIQCLNDSLIVDEPVVPKADFPLAKNVTTNGFSVKETEVIQKLRDLEANKDLFELLSPGTKDEITHLLDDIRRKEEKQKIELYARSLLSVLNKRS